MLGLEGTDLTQIRTVYSHPQALSQCSRFLEEHRQWKQVPVENTAVAVKKGHGGERPVAGGDRKHVRGGTFRRIHLAGADLITMRQIRRDLSLVSNQRVFEEDAKKVSICFELPHKSGSLYNMLSHFIYNNLNMSRIESRPIPGKNWEYRLFR